VYTVPKPRTSSASVLWKPQIPHRTRIAQSVKQVARAGWSGFNSWQGCGFPFCHDIQTDSGTHPASYLVDTRGCFTRDKMTWSVKLLHAFIYFYR
jgi:hypothetical protein